MMGTATPVHSWLVPAVQLISTELPLACSVLATPRGALEGLPNLSLTSANGRGRCRGAANKHIVEHELVIRKPVQGQTYGGTVPRSALRDAEWGRLVNPGKLAAPTTIPPLLMAGDTVTKTVPACPLGGLTRL